MLQWANCWKVRCKSPPRGNVLTTRVDHLQVHAWFRLTWVAERGWISRQGASPLPVAHVHHSFCGIADQAGCNQSHRTLQRCKQHHSSPGCITTGTTPYYFSTHRCPKCARKLLRFRILMIRPLVLRIRLVHVKIGKYIVLMKWYCTLSTVTQVCSNANLSLNLTGTGQGPNPDYAVTGPRVAAKNQCTAGINSSTAFR